MLLTCAGDKKKKDSCEDSPHPTVCKMARRWKRIVTLAAFIGGVVALHYFPGYRSAWLASQTVLENCTPCTIG